MTSPDKAQAEYQPEAMQDILERVTPLSDDRPLPWAPNPSETAIPVLSRFNQASDNATHGRVRDIQDSINNAMARQQHDFSRGMSQMLRELRESNDRNHQIQVAILDELRRPRSQRAHSEREPSLHGSVRSQSPALSYVSEEPQDGPERISAFSSQHRGRNASPAEPDENEEFIARLNESGELDALVVLKKLEFKRSADGQGNFANRRGRNESVSGYDARLTTSARNAILTDLRAGIDPAILFERLSLHRRQARFEDPPRSEPFLTGANSTPLGINPRNVTRDEAPIQTRPRGFPTPSSPSSAGGGSPNDRVPRDSRYSGYMPGIRPSMSASNLGRNPITVGPLTIIDRSSERTDDMVRNEINNALQAAELRSDVVNVGKLMKIPLPEYSGGESMDAYMKFLRELLLYLLNYNLMKPDSDAHRVGILGVTLKDRALRWYQHTINLNADGKWNFQSAMIELKRHFVKDVSARDAAVRFDRLKQKNKTVADLKKELERLSQLMIQRPSEYDMKRRFLDALKPEISGAVLCFGLNPESTDLEILFEKANAIEQGQLYEESHRNERMSRNLITGSHKPSNKPSSGKSTVTPRKTFVKKPTKDGKDDKPIDSSSKSVECYNCKKKGHISKDCPKKTGRSRRSANAEPADQEDEAEAQANAADAESSGSEDSEPHHNDLSDDQSEDQVENNADSDDLSLNDWCPQACAVRPCPELSDDEDDTINYVEPQSHKRSGLVDWSLMPGSCVEYEDTPSVNGHVQIDNPEFTMWDCRTIRIVEDHERMESCKANETNSELVAYRQRATKDFGPLRVGDGPKRDFKRLGVIEGYMRINGHRAHVLLDGGSTLDMISANFASVLALEMFQLKKPIKLQMATSGSRSSINHGARAELQVGEFKQMRYFDVVNLDRYNVILGTPFLKEHKIILNYAGHGSFKLKDRWFPVREGDFSSPLSKNGEETDNAVSGTKSSTKENGFKPKYRGSTDGSNGKEPSPSVPDKRTHH